MPKIFTALKKYFCQIRAEHVKLSWAPPEDDGGTPVLRYLIRLMDLDCAEWITACEVWRKNICPLIKIFPP